jgi:hypothetical protein
MAAERLTSRMLPVHQKFCRTSGICSSRKRPRQFVRSRQLGFQTLEEMPCRPRGLYFVRPLPVTLLAQAASSRVLGASHHRWLLRAKRAANALVMRENARDLGALNSCVASTQNALVLRLRLVCESNTTVFGLSQLGIWIGTREFTL